MKKQEKKQIRVMIVEDEVLLLEITMDNLKAYGYEVCGLLSGINIQTEIRNFHPDLIILDQVMPGKTGQDIVADIRSNPEFCAIPVIMVTAVLDEDQLVKSLNLGVDDYVKKPYSVRELDARIQAVLRRAEGNAKKSLQKITFKDLSLDLSAHRVTLNNVDVPLTLTEYRIAAELLKQIGTVVSRDELRKNALGNLEISDRTLDVHMASLRKKLGDVGQAIETIRGVGYRISNT